MAVQPDLCWTWSETPLTDYLATRLITNEPCHEKTGFLHMQKQRHRSAAQELRS